MSLETPTTLDDETIAALQDLTRTNIDSVKGFKESAEDITDTRVATLFRELAAERASLASELQNYVEMNHEEAVDEGSTAAAIHRTWINLKSSVVGNDTQAVLNEAERGEDYIKGAYESAIKKTAGSAVNDVLLQQYALVKKGHDKVRDLRDAYKATS